MKTKYKLEVKETKKYGKGVFAGEDIKKGDVVHILGGKRMDVKDLVKKVNSKKENKDDPFQIGRRTYLDLNAISRSFNHSCSPNTGIRKTSEMFALRNIKKGEELTYDYSLTASPTEWNMECSCGDKNCRKDLGDITTVPKVQLENYRKYGALQTYMKRLLKEIESGSYRMPRYEILAIEQIISE